MEWRQDTIVRKGFPEDVTFDGIYWWHTESIHMKIDRPSLSSFGVCRRVTCLKFLRRVHKTILSLQAFNFLSYYTSTLLPKSSSDFLQMVRVSKNKNNLTSSALAFSEVRGSVYMCIHTEMLGVSASVQTILYFRWHSLWVIIRETNCI